MSDVAQVPKLVAPPPPKLVPSPRNGPSPRRPFHFVVRRSLLGHTPTPRRVRNARPDPAHRVDPRSMHTLSSNGLCPTQQRPPIKPTAPRETSTAPYGLKA